MHELREGFDEVGEKFLEALLGGQDLVFALRSQPAEAMRNACESDELRSQNK